MIDLELLRREPAAVQSRLQRKVDDIDINEILEYDKRRRELASALDAVRARRKTVAAEIGRSRGTGPAADDLSQEAAAIKTRVAELEKELTETQDALDARLARLPNIPDDRSPSGGKENNKVVKMWGAPPALQSNARDHVQICNDLDIIDYERGTKLGGRGFWLYKGLGAALEWSLLNFFCQQHLADGYTFILPPHLLLDFCGFAAGQFPKFRDDVFHLASSGDDRSRFLLPTAETAILNIYGGEILDKDQLPLKMFAYTPCYRREAGSYRTEERGTIRGHQFNKVEMFQFVEPDGAEGALDELVSKAQRLVEQLGLHYRTSLLAAKDMSESMKLTYDIEVWIPSINAYKEVSSVSWAGDYQARRANIRYRAPGKKGTSYVHTLNGSGLATSRLVPAIVEQFQRADGGVTVPEALRQGLGVDVIAPKR